MVLLNSSAHHIYWLGRYLMRIQFAVSHLPFTDDAKAAQFAAAFGLVIDQAELLNCYMLDTKQTYSLLNQFAIAKDNIQELRGILSSNAYAELNHAIKGVQAHPDSLKQALAKCNQILDAEHEDIALFLHLGQKIELFDIQLRFQQDLTQLLQELEQLLQQLNDLGWNKLTQPWQLLKDHPNWDAYYNFTQQLEYMFEA
ncbi:alpha-E domain-containing protein [Acinetobacter baumannii]|uniref:alpha-E domain-containing protein n=1 Tax=Acinetobacter baumannii TaxID=470 RepID=UPI00081993FF|nr:alpha-E domain-containing protein [Acinetobacter baumannii]EIB7122881.1 alpha-E domain-containing protein [Acinetobacter baumannii]MCT9282213.1 alpha-E domain-containing protein [Acinetobacter baumannii]MDA5695100.1 alpha-E domain-containing protein [Acinetobacter baumannii]MDC4379471.1 alpha-E domain-containing protein [Acinetobacter baumannii]MDC4773885.1 alpha-E domain-containing protein [Acinetobacter baumannii]